MATQTVIETTQGEISYPGRSICIGLDGTIYVAYVVSSPAAAVHVYKSTDQGATWTSFVSFTGSTGYSFAQILADSAGRLHLFYNLRVSSVYTFVHRSWISGTGWSTAHTIIDTIDAGHEFVAVVDTDDTLHHICMYSSSRIHYEHSTDQGATWTDNGTISTGTAGWGKLCLGIDTDSNLHFCYKYRGNFGGGHATNTNIEYLKKNYGGAWESAEWATSYGTVSPYDQDPFSIIVNASGEVIILYKYGYATAATRCAVRAVGGGWSQEVMGDGQLHSGDLVIDSGGRLFAIMTSKTPRDYSWQERTATDTWGAVTTIINDVGSTAYFRIESLYAVFPPITGIPLSGFASMLLSATPAVEFYNNAVLVGHYPSDTRARVTGLIHRYNRGVYNLELFLGDVTAEWDLSDYDYISKAEDLEYYRWRNLAYQDDYMPFPGKPVRPLSEYEEPSPYPYRPWGREEVRPPTPGGDWRVPHRVIFPEWAQGATPYEQSGLFRTAEELRYGPNIGPIERHLQRAKAEEEGRPPPIEYVEPEDIPKPPSSADMPKCPAGQIARFYQGKWSCAPITGKFGGY